MKNYEKRMKTFVPTSYFLQDEVVNIKSFFNKIKGVCEKIRDLNRRDKSKMKLDRLDRLVR